MEIRRHFSKLRSWLHWIVGPTSTVGLATQTRLVFSWSPLNVDLAAVAQASHIDVPITSDAGTEILQDIVG